jgi:hypothetical protein
MTPAEQLADGILVPAQKMKRLAGSVRGGEEIFHELDRLIGLGLVEDKAIDELGAITPR